MLTRRAALQGGTATVVAIAAGGAVAARVAVDPIVALRDERERMRTTINSLADHYDAHTADEMANILVHDLCRTEVQILEAEPQTLAGALAQVEQLCLWDEDGVVVGGDVAIARLIEVLPERIERLAGRAQS